MTSGLATGTLAAHGGMAGETLSPTTLPSRISMMRWAWAATSESWVTRTIVMPPCSSRPRRSKKRAVDVESRLPVGSSASRIFGSLARARAMATRCRSPPDSSVGSRCSHPFRSTSARSSTSPVPPLVGGSMTAEHRELDVEQGGKLGQKVVELEDEAHLVASVVAQVVEVGQIMAGHDDRYPTSGSRWRPGC